MQIRTKKYLLLMLVFYLLNLGLAVAQTVQRNLLSRFTLDQVSQALIPQSQWRPFPKTPAAWREQLPDSVIQKLIKKGESSLNITFEDIPASVTLEYIRTGDRDHFQSISFKKREQLLDLVLAESMEGKGRFVDQIMNGVWSISEESFWGVPAHIHFQKAGDGLPDVQDPIIDLFVMETATVFSLTDYFVGEALDKVSPLIRPRIYYEVNRRIFTPMLTANYYWLGLETPEKKVNNWSVWVVSNYMASMLLLEKDQAKRANAVVYALKVMDHFINSLGEDGSTEEGPSYWFAATGSLYDGLDMLADATEGKLTVYDQPFIQKAGSYIYKMHIAGKYFFNVGDADPQLTPDGLSFYRFGKATKDSTMMQMGAWAHQTYAREGKEQNWHRMRRLYNYKVLKEVNGLPPVQFPGIPNAWLSDIQVMIARSPNGLFVATHGGHNAESHNHNDVGDFVIYNNGEPVIVDVGRGTYTYKMFRGDRYGIWFNNSAYHNLPTINGYVQPKGRKSEVTEVRHHSYPDGVEEVQMNIGTAYPKEAGIRKWERTVRMEKNSGITIKDAYQMASSLKSLTQSFMTVTKVSLDAPGKISFELPSGEKVYMKYDPSQWEAKKEKMELNAPEDQKLKTSWDGKEISRVLLTSKSKNRKGQFSYVFYK